MTNDEPKAIPTDPYERRLMFSAAKVGIVMPTRKARRLPPRNRRHSVKHRAIR